MSTFRYKAFISYSWKDRVAVEALHRALEAFRPPKSLGARAGERLVPIFRDRDEEAAGANLKAAIEDALDNSEFLIVACSPNARQSPWVNREIAYFRKRRAPANVLCYGLEGDPGPDIFPPALVYESTSAGEISDQLIEAPLAADAREVGDGPRLARLKIAAAMLGVGLDDLVRRDVQRRARRMRAALGVVSAVALGFAGVAAYAVLQRNEAVASAERARRAALKADRTTEFMVSLFQVVDPGEARGREVTAKEILDKGVATVEHDLAGEPDVQGALMHSMGRSYTGLGLYPEASRILTVARDRRVAAKADPADIFATKSALARALFEKGDLDGAHEIYAELVTQTEADIAKGGWRTEYAATLIGMGETTLYRDTPEEAKRFYERARDLIQRHESGSSLQIANALQGLAAAQTDLNEFQNAESNLLAARKNLMELFPGGHFKLTAVENDLGYNYYMSRQLDKAIAAAKRSLDGTRKIVGEAHPETLTSANNLARYEFEAGNLEKAWNDFVAVLAGFDAAGRQDHFFKAFPLNSIAEIEIEWGRLDSAILRLEAAQRLATTDSSRLLGTISLNRGRVECERGNTERGLELIAIGRAQLPEHYEPGNWRFAVADEFESRCRALVGETQIAQRLAISAAAAITNDLGEAHYFSKRATHWSETIGR